MSRTLTPGSYDGKIVDYGIGKTKKDKPQAFIVFEIPVEDKLVRLTWYGLLDPKPSEEGKRAPSEITVATLLDCGYSAETIEMMAAGPTSNALEIGHEMTLVVEDNTWEGETNSRIKYVNIKGQSRGPVRMSYEQASAGLPSGALKAQLMRARAGKGGATNVPKSPL